MGWMLGGGVLEGKEGRLYAAVGVFWGFMPFVLGSRGAAGGLRCVSDTCSSSPGLALVGECLCVHAAGPMGSRSGQRRAQIHFHKSFFFLTSHQGYALGSRRRP